MKKEIKQPGMSNDTKSIIAVLALLLAYPIGVIVMWFLTKWPKWVKLLVTAPLILIPLIAVFIVAVVVITNPQKKFEKAQRAQCVKQCIKNASDSDCVKTCVNKYKSEIKSYYLSPAPTVVPTY